MLDKIDPERFDRFCRRHWLDRRAWLAIILFMYGHPEQEWLHETLRFTRGEGPAAVAMGRSKR